MVKRRLWHGKRTLTKLQRIPKTEVVIIATVRRVEELADADEMVNSPTLLFLHLRGKYK